MIMLTIETASPLLNPSLSALLMWQVCDVARGRQDMMAHDEEPVFSEFPPIECVE